MGWRNWIEEHFSPTTRTLEFPDTQEADAGQEKGKDFFTQRIINLQGISLPEMSVMAASLVAFKGGLNRFLDNNQLAAMMRK